MEIWGIPIKYAVGMGGGWLTAVSTGAYVLRMVLTRKLIPEATHLEIVARVVDYGDGWHTAYNELAEVNSQNALQNLEWSETSRLIRDYIAAQDRANAIEAARRAGDTP